MFFGRRNWIESLWNRSTSPSRRRLHLRGNLSAQSSEIELLEDRTLLSNFSIADVTAVETDANSINFFFTVTRSVNTAAETVTFSTADGTATAADGDYTARTGTLTFAAGGALTQNIAILVHGDTKVEANETFFVNLSTTTAGAVITDSQAVGTLTNDDAASLTIGNVTQVETNSGTTFFNFQITLDKAVSGGVNVNYASANGTATAGSDFQTAAGTLNFAGTAGETKAATVIVNGDLGLEADETFTVVLSGIAAQGAGVNSANITATGSPATGTITNDDTAKLSINDVTAVETAAGTTFLVFSVTLDQAAVGAFTVDFSTADGTATAGSDYTTANGTLNFAGTTGEVQTIAVQVSGDTTIENDETFFVNLSNVTGGVAFADNQGLGTISNDDAPIPIAPTLTGPNATTNDTTPTIIWSAVTGATTYELLVYNIATGQEVINQTGLTTTQFTPTTPLNQATHQAFVRAVNVGGNGPYSAAQNFSVQMDSPSLTTLFAVTSNNTPTISWPAVIGAATYELLLYNTGTGQLDASQTGITTPQFTPTVPLANGMHQVFVRAIDTFGIATAYSAAQTFELGTAAPTFTAPIGSVGDTTPTITWTAVGGAVSYELLVYDSLRGRVVINQTNITTAQFTPTTALAMVSHQAFVRAVDSSGTVGAYSTALNFSVVLGAPVITAPTGTSNDTTPTITWNAVGGAASYDLLLYHTSTGRLFASQTGITATQFTPGPLARGGHQVFVRAVTGSGIAGAYSAAGVFTVMLAAPALTSPIGLSSNRTPTFAWNAVDGAASYQLLIYNVSTGQLVGNLSNIFGTQVTQGTPVIPDFYQGFLRGFDTFGLAGPYGPALNFRITSTSSAELTPRTDSQKSPAAGNPAETVPLFPAELKLVRLDEFDETVEQSEFESVNQRQPAELDKDKTNPFIAVSSARRDRSSEFAAAEIDAVWIEWPQRDLWQEEDSVASNDSLAGDSLTGENMVISDDLASSEKRTAAVGALVLFGTHNLLTIKDDGERAKTRIARRKKRRPNHES